MVQGRDMKADVLSMFIPYLLSWKGTSHPKVLMLMLMLMLAVSNER